VSMAVKRGYIYDDFPGVLAMGTNFRTWATDAPQLAPGVMGASVDKRFPVLCTTATLDPQRQDCILVMNSG
jgi:hypothetical protein